jgi:HAMP domain-containing protein
MSWTDTELGPLFAYLEEKIPKYKGNSEQFKGLKETLIAFFNVEGNKDCNTQVMQEVAAKDLGTKFFAFTNSEYNLPEFIEFFKAPGRAKCVNKSVSDLLDAMLQQSQPEHNDAQNQLSEVNRGSVPFAEPEEVPENDIKWGSVPFAEPEKVPEEVPEEVIFQSKQHQNVYLNSLKKQLPEESNQSGVKGDNAQFAKPESADVISQNFMSNNPLDVNSLVVKKKQDPNRQRVLTNLERLQNILTVRNDQLANAQLSNAPSEEIEELNKDIGSMRRLLEKEYFNLEKHDNDVAEKKRKKERDARLVQIGVKNAASKERRVASKAQRDASKTHSGGGRRNRKSNKKGLRKRKSNKKGLRKKSRSRRNRKSKKH